MACPIGLFCIFLDVERYRAVVGRVLLVHQKLKTWCFRLGVAKLRREYALRFLLPVCNVEICVCATQ